MTFIAISGNFQNIKHFKTHNIKQKKPNLLSDYIKLALLKNICLKTEFPVGKLDLCE